MSAALIKRATRKKRVYKIQKYKCLEKLVFRIFDGVAVDLYSHHDV